MLADIRDRELIERVFDTERPEVVFHAAAHKHVPLLEAHPCEAVNTNIFGTLNVVDAAAQCGVGALRLHLDRQGGATDERDGRVEVVRGADRARCERTAAPSSARSGSATSSEAAGSVIPMFERQIAEGGPVTVTDPRMTRYFMSIREAVQLVLQTAASDDDGVLMLEMGQPVNILELAERMIRLSGREVDEVGIEFTGARPGEALVEEMRGPFEVLEPTDTPGIVSVRPISLPSTTVEHALDDLAAAVARRDDVAAGARLRSVIGSAARIPVADSPAHSEDLAAWRVFRTARG